MNDKAKNILLWLVITAILVTVFSNFGPSHSQLQSYSYSQFVNTVTRGDVAKVTIADRAISGVTKNGQQFTTYIPMEDPSLIEELIKQNVEVVGKQPEQRGLLLNIFISWFPMLLLIGVWFWFMRQMQGGGAGGRKGPMSFGSSRARMLVGDQVKIKFKDVAGIEEALDEVEELVAYLRDPAKFQKLGATIPCGALLIGPPGTGKTLLAKAVAGEADVPFFSISGSDFVEMFVGVGASRVRDMFDQAKKQAPCIIFIDEIDAVGRHRGAGLGGGHDEREQTLNQLLVEMDGFEGKEGIIVMAATNRPDVLDPALLRPGRFDRQVTVPLPDVKGREHILKVHMDKVSTAKQVDASLIARGTPGFSGADLANLVNEAALSAARKNKKRVSQVEFEQAKDKIMMGTERRSMAMSDDEKRLTAYHEAGHAIVGLYVPEHDPVYKVTIIPRGRALGVTVYLPETDRYSYSIRRLESQISSLYGGRIAEEMIFGEQGITTGASNDIERASELARKFVTKWGFSDKLGPISYGNDEEEVFVGRSMNKDQSMSDETLQKIDKEVAKLIARNYDRAKKILEKHIKQLHAMAGALIEYETIDQDQIKEIMAGNDVTPPDGWEKSAKKSKHRKSNDKGSSKNEEFSEFSDDVVEDN